MTEIFIERNQKCDCQVNTKQLSGTSINLKISTKTQNLHSASFGEGHKEYSILGQKFFIFTARIQRMGEGNIFSLFTSVWGRGPCTQVQGGTPFPGPGRRRWRVAPTGPEQHSHTIFGEKWLNSRLALSLRLTSYSGKSWIRHCSISHSTLYP